MRRRSGTDRRGPGPAGTRGGVERYPRTARVNEVLREVIAEELERLCDEDERLLLTTVTGVLTEPGLRHATVFVDSLSEERRAGLDDQRVHLQAAIARQVRLKRTPRLSFEADPAVASGEGVESLLRGLHDGEDGETGAAAPDEEGEHG